MSGPPGYIASPCVKVCALDPATGLCSGCFRTVREIAEWIDMTPEERRATIERAEARRHGDLHPAAQIQSQD
jgi:predicted Fe-S protein YdhL (DUF1289 family)